MSAPGSDVLQAITQARGKLVELERRLRQHPDAESTDSATDFLPSDFPNSIPLTMWLEVYVGNGEPLVWTIDIAWYDGWRIWTQVTYSFGDETEDVRRWPERRFSSAGEFVQGLEEAVRELITSAEEIDIVGYAKRARDSPPSGN